MNANPEWKPIASAPKDGSLILLGREAIEDCDAISVPGFWQEGWEDSIDDMGCDSGFVDVQFQEFSGGRSFGAESYRCAPNQPTHWMPLPPAPTSHPIPTGATGEEQDERKQMAHKAIQWATPSNVMAAPLLACEHIRGMAALVLSNPAAGDVLVLPDLNADLIDILGKPNFTCIRIAHLLRLGGVEIATKAEAEQATVIHYLLGFYLKHGSQWAEKANEDLNRRRDAAIAQQSQRKEA